MQLEGLVPRTSLSRVKTHDLAPPPGPPKKKKKKKSSDTKLTDEQKQKNLEKRIQDFRDLTNLSKKDATLWNNSFPDRSAQGLFDIIYQDNQNLFEAFPPGELRDLEIFRLRAPNASKDTRRQFLLAYGDLNTAVNTFITDPSDIDKIKLPDEDYQNEKNLANFIKKTGATPEDAELFLTNFRSFNEAFEAYSKNPKFFEDGSSGGETDLANS